MVTRTARRILVSEAELSAALRIVAEATVSAGDGLDIEVREYVDPEIEEDAPVTLIVGHVRRARDYPEFVGLFLGVVRALKLAGLYYPAIALKFHLSPEW